MYVRDFTVHPWSGGDWLCRLIAVGWIEAWKPFDKGPVDRGVVARLRALRESFETRFRDFQFRGGHHCSLCRKLDPGVEPLRDSHVNLLVPHRGFVFLAPGRVDHYVETHGYRPPDSFVEAVLACPLPTEPAFREALRAANRGVDAPLSPRET